MTVVRGDAARSLMARTRAKVVRHIDSPRTDSTHIDSTHTESAPEGGATAADPRASR